MKDIKMMAAVVAATIGTLGAYAGGGGTTVALTPLSPASQGEAGAAAQSEAAESDTVKVQGRGVGVDKAAALKDAYRDAIERAVGLYVDAETAANNDQIVKDQILTQSNAYITDYRELGEEKIDGGLVQLRILATVKKVALTTKLSGVMPAQTVAINNTSLQNVHAQLVTKEKRAEDAAALLKNALDGIDPMKSLMVASIRPETQKILTGDTIKMNNRPLTANQVLLRYLFEVKLDRAKYFAEFVPNLKKVLDQISLVPPKELRLMELMPADEDNQHFRGLKDYLDKGCDDSGWNDVRSNVGIFINGTSNCSDCSAYLDPIHVYSISWQGNNWVWAFGHDQYRPKSGGAFRWQNVNLMSGDFEEHYRKDKVCFALITSLNADCSNGKVTMYELDKSVIAALNEWRKGLIDASAHEQKTTNYNIVLLDKDDNEIGVYPWQIPNGVLMNVKFAEIPAAGMVYATPFVGCFGENFIQWRDFVLQQDDLAKIASVKIELAD